MKKKVVAAFMAATMAATLLVGCGGGSTEEATSSAVESSAAEESAAPEESAAEESSAPEESAAEEAEAPAGEEVDIASLEKPTIAFVPKVLGQAWWDHVQANVEEWGAEYGVDVIYKGPTEVDAAAQVQIMTDLVNQGVDVLCFSPNDPDACEAICKEALDKGIIVIATEASGMQNVTYDIEAFDETGLGGFLMQQLAEQMGEEGEYITMVGSMTMESQNNWADAAVAYAEANYPNMTLVEDARVADDSDAEKAYELTKELKQKYPNLKGILGTGSFDAPGAARAIQEMGLTGQMFAISVAMPLEVADYLEDGTLGSVALWDAGISAKVMLNTAVMLYNGIEITTGSNLGEEGYDNVTVDGTLIVGEGQIAITTENCYDFGF